MALIFIPVKNSASQNCADRLTPASTVPTLLNCIKELSKNIVNIDQKLNTSSVLPQDAIIIIDREVCPPGWETFTLGHGRFVVGVGNPLRNHSSANGPSEKKYLQTGGEEKVRLDADNMPPHSHEGSTGPSSAVAVINQSGPGIINGWNIVQRSGEKLTINEHEKLPLNISQNGRGTPANNLPPFIAMRYCKLSK